MPTSPPELETPQAHAAPPILALLVTRCQCQRVVKVPNNPLPKTVTVDLVPLKGQPEKRTFYLAGETTLDGQILLVYREGANPDRPRILVPGLVPPKDLRKAA